MVKIDDMVEVTKLLTEYQILTKYLIKKIVKDEYIDREELKDLLLAFDFKMEEKEIENE